MVCMLVSLDIIRYHQETRQFKMTDNEDQHQDEQKKILVDKNNNIQYIRGKLLGTGGFAKCFQVINQENHNLYAAKVIPKKSINQKRQRYKLLVQIKIHRSLKHKHIVQFIQSFQDRENVYILLQYCQNYTLKDLVKRRKRISEYQTRIYIQQIVKALSYIHSHSIIHRDLKLGNILINDHMHTKICDFGLSTRVKNQGELKKTICGTPNYIAPQILEENGHSYEVDIWSIGVIMYTLLFGKPPFEDNTVQQTYDNIKKNRFSYPSSVQVSSRAKDLINKILVTDPSRRYSLSEILQHSFMKNREQLPKELPCYTIAIPPIKILELQNKVLGGFDGGEGNFDVSEEVQNGFGGDNANFGARGQADQDSTLKSKLANFRAEDSLALGMSVYVRDCFVHEDMFGYLLTNATIGVFFLKTGTNAIMPYGCSNYIIIPSPSSSSSSSSSPCSQVTKHPIPAHKLAPESPTQCAYLSSLKNFRSYFLTAHSIFKLDQLYKKYQNSSAYSQSFLSSFDKNEEFIHVRKFIELKGGHLLVRLANSVVQFCFVDRTAVFVDRSERAAIVFVDLKGVPYEIEYSRCQDKQIKKKIRLFRNLLEKLSDAAKERN